MSIKWIEWTWPFPSWTQELTLQCVAFGKQHAGTEGLATPLIHNVERLLPMKDNDAVETVVSYLRSSERNSRPPATLETLDEFERTYRVLLPSDMRRLYESVDGMMRDDLLQGSFIRLLSIDEIVPVRDFLGTEELQPADAFVFADHSIGADFFAIRLGQSDARAAVFLAGAPPRLVAEGFSEFLAKVIDNDDSLLLGEGAV